MGTSKPAIRFARHSHSPLPLPLVVFDEFTSVVDRNVARACSAAIAKGIRRGHIPCRFVAVTCHYDVAEWLEADWVLDMATLRSSRGGVFGDPASTWKSIAAAWLRGNCLQRHHYLSGSLAPARAATWPRGTASR